MGFESKFEIKTKDLIRIYDVTLKNYIVNNVSAFSQKCAFIFEYHIKLLRTGCHHFYGSLSKVQYLRTNHWIMKAQLIQFNNGLSKT